jgi:hypothetical protein
MVQEDKILNALLEELIELDDEKKKIKDASSVGPMYLD